MKISMKNAIQGLLHLASAAVCNLLAVNFSCIGSQHLLHLSLVLVGKKLIVILQANLFNQSRFHVGPAVLCQKNDQKR